MIAGHARSRGLVVVTANLKEFEWVDGQGDSPGPIFTPLPTKTHIPADFMGKADPLANDPVIDPFGDLAE